MMLSNDNIRAIFVLLISHIFLNGVVVETKRNNYYSRLAYEENESGHEGHGGGDNSNPHPTSEFCKPAETNTEKEKYFFFPNSTKVYKVLKFIFVLIIDQFRVCLFNT